MISAFTSKLNLLRIPFGSHLMEMLKQKVGIPGSTAKTESCKCDLRIHIAFGKWACGVSILYLVYICSHCILYASSLFGVWFSFVGFWFGLGQGFLFVFFMEGFTAVEVYWTASLLSFGTSNYIDQARGDLKIMFWAFFPVIPLGSRASDTSPEQLLL